MTDPGPPPPRSGKESSDADDVAAVERAGAKQTARDARREARRARAAARDDDRIVEAPRGPKTPLLQRLRGASAGGGSRIRSFAAAAIGAVALICSVILAVGALLIALGSDDGSVYDAFSGTCDVLVGPLRDAFSFSGAKADMKEALVAWGAGSIGYLVLSLVAQSISRPAGKD